MSEPNEPQEPAQGDPDALGDSGKKALQAIRKERDDALRRAADLENQVSTLQTTHQQALEAANNAAAEAATRAEKAESGNLRYRVALEEGVPAKHINRLQGDTEEALREDAAAFVADFTPAPTTPKPDLSQGAKGEPAKSSTADQFASAIEGALNNQA